MEINLQEIIQLDGMLQIMHLGLIFAD